MKKMKFTKLLPAALALMLLGSAAYAATDNASSQLQITVPEFINITKESGSVETTSATFDDSYTTITLSPTLNATFKVINNQPDRMVYLKGTAPTSGSGEVNALYGTDEQQMKLVFTNITHQAEEAAVTNITSASGTAFADNANAIAFAISSSANFAPDSSSGAQDVTGTFSDNTASYQISNGIYNPVYTIGTTAEANTFSTHDTNGTYQATLTLTTTGP